MSWCQSLFLLLLLSLGIDSLRGEDLLMDRTEELTGEQDELSADVQELVEMQTDEALIKQLEELEEIMIEVTLRLDEGHTDGPTIAAQTDIIERSYEAAKQKNAQEGASQTSQAMMEMLKKMLGKPSDTPQGEQKQQPGAQAGKAESSSAQGGAEGAQGDPPPAGRAGKRTVPRLSGSIQSAFPEEFQELLDDYNAMKKKELRN